MGGRVPVNALIAGLPSYSSTDDVFERLGLVDYGHAAEDMGLLDLPLDLEKELQDTLQDIDLSSNLDFGSYNAIDSFWSAIRHEGHGQLTSSGDEETQFFFGVQEDNRDLQEQNLPGRTLPNRDNLAPFFVPPHSMQFTCAPVQDGCHGIRNVGENYPTHVSERVHGGSLHSSADGIAREMFQGVDKVLFDEIVTNCLHAMHNSDVSNLNQDCLDADEEWDNGLFDFESPAMSPMSNPNLPPLVSAASVNTLLSRQQQPRPFRTNSLGQLDAYDNARDLFQRAALLIPYSGPNVYEVPSGLNRNSKKVSGITHPLSPSQQLHLRASPRGKTGICKASSPRSSPTLSLLDQGFGILQDDDLAPCMSAETAYAGRAQAIGNSLPNSTTFNCMPSMLGPSRPLSATSPNLSSSVSYASTLDAYHAWDVPYSQDLLLEPPYPASCAPLFPQCQQFPFPMEQFPNFGGISGQSISRLPSSSSFELSSDDEAMAALPVATISRKTPAKKCKADTRPAAAPMKPRTQQNAPGVEITRAMVQEVFHLPIGEAARALNIGTTVLKRWCRSLKIGRWPFRKLQSINKLITKFTSLPLPDQDESVQEVLMGLTQARTAIYHTPDTEFDGDVKRLRQANFKIEYKERQVMERQFMRNAMSSGPADLQARYAALTVPYPQPAPSDTTCYGAGMLGPNYA